MKAHTLILLLLVILLRKESSSQENRLVVLGTIQDAGYPQVGCLKDCCAGKNRTVNTLQTVASVAIADNKTFFIIDATPDFSFQFDMAKTEFPDHDFGGILLTHAHIGHYTGLMYLGREAMNGQSIPVYVMPRLKRFIESNGPWNQLVELDNIQLIELTADRSFQLTPTLQVTPLLVPHRDEYSETVAFQVRGQQTILYLPDIDKWDKWSQDIKQLIETSQYAFLDGTFYATNELPGRNMDEIPHPFVLESLKSFEALSQKDRDKVYFIHFNHTNPLIDSESLEYKTVEEAGFHVSKSGLSFGF